MKLRNFDIGRQQESLLNEEHYNIFKILEPYLKNGSPNDPSSGPISVPGTTDEIIEGAVWIDKSSDPTNSDLKYFSNGQWNLFFKDRFKITQDIISIEEPSEPIEGQLWIDQQGTLNYYYKGVWKPIKAVPDNLHADANLQGFEDFIITESLTATEQMIIDNFTSWLLAEVPVPQWEEGVNYVPNQGCVKDLNIYVCKLDHDSDPSNAPGNTYYWTKVQKLFQYIVPNSREDKFYLDGFFVHEECPIKEADLVPTAIAGEFKAGEKTAQHLQREKNGHEHDDSCRGFKANTDISISFPIEMVDGKTANAVHVNPKRLHSVTKKFIMIDKLNPIIEVPEENTEFYGFYGGVGKLLLKTDDPNTTEYTSVVSNNIDCIKLSRKVAYTYDFVYAIHYEFLDTKIKTLGTVTKKRQKLNDSNYIWIGPANGNNLCVFAQGLFYAQDKDDVNPTWSYNPETEYLYISEKLQDYENMVKTFDFSVIQFPEKFEGVVTDNFEMVNGKEMFRINLPAGYPKSTNFIVFTSGLELDVVAGEVVKHSTNPRVIYIPSITRDMFLNSDKIFYCVAGCQGTFDGKEVDMYRGSVTASYARQFGVHIPIYTDPNYPIENGLLLRDNEAPLLFVDGVLVFQSEIERGNDYITIYGLQQGQEVLLLADYKDPSLGDDELSDSLIFEDTVSYSTIPTPQSDATIVYVANSILSDASAVYTSKKPEGEGYHGEIRYHINYDADTWYKYDGTTGKWVEILPSEMYTDPITQEQTPLIDVLDKNSRGYTHSKKSVSFLQNINDQVCTYLAYQFSDSIEKPLLMGYAYPNGKDGVNVNSSTVLANPQPFKTSGRHVYVPGRNELTLYLNGIRQEVNSPNDIGFSNSKNREGAIGKYDEFVLAIDDGTKEGQALSAEEGYHVYSLKKWNEESSVVSNKALSNSEIKAYEDKGWKVEYISQPNRNVVFYVIEPCETGEYKACTRKVLTYKNALSSEGAYVNNTYTTDDFLLTRGNIRVFINGLRQPYGNYTTLESLETDDPYRLAYKIIDQRTIEIQDPLIGGMGGNEGSLNNPLFEIGEVQQPDGSFVKKYHEVIDTIVIESRTDNKLREMTIPIKDNSGEFSEEDGLPSELFKTKDRVMIYINGMAYGKEYKIEDNKIKLLNSEIRQMLGNSKKDIITFEWR
jgi:hypothetical protein